MHAAMHVLIVGAGRGIGLEPARQYRAAGIRRVMAGLTPADHGGFFDVDGTPLPW